MLTPKFLESVSDPAVALWRQVEDDILRDMARRISTYDYDIPSAMYQRQRLEAAGMLRKDVIKRLSRMTGKSQKEIRRLMQLAGQETVKTDQEIYTRAQIYKASMVNTAALNRALQGGVIQTNGVMKNLCQTTATMAQKQFCNLLDRAWLQVSSGAFDIDSAVRNACKSLAASGIHAVQYSGRAMSLESAVRMIVRTGVNQTAAKLQLELADEFETDLVQVTAHAGARPDHEVWQGKVFSISGKTKGYQKLSTATGYGTVEGLCGANCRHNFFPTWDGVDDVYPKELLEEYARKDAYSYNGKKMSEYEATQVQRKIERNIRKWQREFITMEAAGQDTVEAGAKLKEWKSKERDFLKQTGLKKRSGYSVNNPIGKAERSYGIGIGSPITNLTYINSDAYKEKFRGITDDRRLDQLIYQRCKAAVTHQSGTYYEDLSIISLKTMRLIGQTSGVEENVTLYTDKLKQLIADEPPFSLISIHNHGTNIPPTGADFGSSGHHKYAFGIVACNDGTVYYYSTANATPFATSLADSLVDKYSKRPYNLTIDRAAIKALEYLKSNYGIDWRVL